LYSNYIGYVVLCCVVCGVVLTKKKKESIE
jgi:hypothetical protein